MSTKRRRRFPIEVLSPDEVRALLNACSTTPIGIRHRAMIAIMYRAGLRICEVLDLYPKDVDLERGAIRVLNGKGGRSRTVGIDPGGIAMLKAWIEVRTSLGLTGIHPLICTVRGNRLTEAYVRRLLPKLGRKAGIAKRVHAHGPTSMRQPTATTTQDDASACCSPTARSSRPITTNSAA